MNKASLNKWTGLFLYPKFMRLKTTISCLSTSKKNDLAKDRKILETCIESQEYKLHDIQCPVHNNLTIDKIVKQLEAAKINSHEYIYNIARIIYNDSTKGGNAMSITATELKQNLGKYLLLSVNEDIYITRNGKTIAKLTNPNQNRVEVAKSLFGILPIDADIEESRKERLDSK